MEIEYTDQALKQLEKLAKGNKKIIRLIIEKIESYADNPKGHHDVKHLKGEYKDFIRLRVGDFRVIFLVENDIIIISMIKHRQGAYND